MASKSTRKVVAKAPKNARHPAKRVVAPKDPKSHRPKKLAASDQQPARRMAGILSVREAKAADGRLGPSDAAKRKAAKRAEELKRRRGR